MIGEIEMCPEALGAAARNDDVSSMLRGHAHRIRAGNRTNRATDAGEKAIVVGQPEFGDNVDFFF